MHVDTYGQKAAAGDLLLVFVRKNPPYLVRYTGKNSKTGWAVCWRTDIGKKKAATNLKQENFLVVTGIQEFEDEANRRGLHP